MQAEEYALPTLLWTLSSSQGLFARAPVSPRVQLIAERAFCFCFRSFRRVQSPDSSCLLSCDGDCVLSCGRCGEVSATKGCMRGAAKDGERYCYNPSKLTRFTAVGSFAVSDAQQYLWMCAQLRKADRHTHSDKSAAGTRAAACVQAAIYVCFARHRKPSPQSRVGRQVQQTEAMPTL